MKEKDAKKGTEVEWRSMRGTSHGKVVEKVTEPTQVGKHKVKASKEHPQVRVESDSTGQEAVHKPGSLKKT